LAPSFAVSAIAATGRAEPDPFDRLARLVVADRRELVADLRLEEFERRLELLALERFRGEL
jgi:hypothetical protein